MEKEADNQVIVKEVLGKDLKHGDEVFSETGFWKPNRAEIDVLIKKTDKFLVKIVSPNIKDNITSSEAVLDEVVKENRTSANKQLTFAYTHKEVITAMDKFHAMNSNIEDNIEDIINALPLGTFAISAPYHIGDSWSIHTNDDDFMAPTLTEALIMYKESLNKQ